MVLIKAGVEIIIKISDNAAGNGSAHSKNVDEDVQLVLHHVTDGNEELVF